MFPFGGYGPFGGTFGLVGILFPVMFLLVFFTFLFFAIQGIRTWNRNNRSPRLDVAATVVSRRSEVSRHRHHTQESGHIHHTASTWYYVTFQFASGDRMEFAVSGQEYGLLAEGDQGTLTFQGTRYLSFTRT